MFSGPRTTKTAYTVSSRASRRDIKKRCRWKAYEGGVERRLEDGPRRYATWDVHGQTIRLKEQGVAGETIPESTVSPHPFLSWIRYFLPSADYS